MGLRDEAYAVVIVKPRLFDGWPDGRLFDPLVHEARILRVVHAWPALARSFHPTVGRMERLRALWDALGEAVAWQRAKRRGDYARRVAAVGMG